MKQPFPIVYTITAVSHACSNPLFAGGIPSRDGSASVKQAGARIVSILQASQAPTIVGNEPIRDKLHITQKISVFPRSAVGTAYQPLSIVSSALMALHNLRSSEQHPRNT
jgi:hypothetical protein